MKHSRRYKESKSRIDSLTEYSVEEAVEMLKEMPAAKFDETVEISIGLGIDPKHADQQVRGTVSLSHGIGKDVRVLVIAKGSKQKEAEEAGADFVGYENLVKKIEGGWTDFDAMIATPDVMGDVVKLGRILGPRGLMPNPKVGTVTMDVAKVVKELKAGRLELRTDKYGVIHTPVGKVSFESVNLAENIKELISTVIRMKPAVVKGTYLKSMTLSSTMGPGIKINKSSVTAK